MPGELILHCRTAGPARRAKLLLHRNIEGREAPVKAYGRLTAGLPDGIVQIPTLLFRGRHRLFDKYMFAGAERFQTL